MINKKVSYYDLCNRPGQTTIKTLAEIVEIIRSDALKGHCDIIRQLHAAGKEESRRIYKAKNLPGFTAAGTFSYRAKTKLIEASGLAALDIDDYTAGGKLKNDICKEPYVVMAFESPTGGLKVIVRIKKVKNYEEYEQVYVQLLNYFAKYSADNDISNKDISRLCFLSHDPDLYLNENASEFSLAEPVAAQPPKPASDKDTSRSAQEYGEVCRLIKKGLDKKTVFEKMMAWEKWTHAPEAYRETTYNKAINNIQTGEKIDLPFNTFTDLLGMADNFIKSQPIYYDNSKIWWVWNADDCCWQQTDETNIMNALDDALQNGAATIRLKNDICEALRRRARKARPKELPHNCVQFKDEIVNIQTGEKMVAGPSYFTTNPIPHKIGITEDTPNIDKLFKEWVVGGDQDESYVKTLYQVFAYSMLSDQFMQRLVAFTGTGSNGKGCCMQMLMKFIGKQNICSTELAALANGRFEASGLYKKLVAVMGEADAFDLKNTNLIKQLSGQDLIKYEFKGKTPFTDESSTTCIISTNSLPITPDASDGFYRRWLVIEFPHQFKIGGDILSTISEQEYENLAKKCIGIAKELYETKSFANEGNIQQRRQKYEERSNPMAKFIESYCEDSTDRFIAFPIFYQAFSKYLIHQRLRAMSKRTVSKTLRMENWVVKNHTYNKPEGGQSTVLAIQDLQFKDIIFSINIENIENIKNVSRFYIGNDLRNGYFRYFGYLTPPEQVPKYIQDEQIPEAVEEIINFNCSICNSSPCAAWDKRGRPICDVCKSD